MNRHNNLTRTTQVPLFRCLRAVTTAALPTLVAIVTVFSLAFPSLAQTVPHTPAAPPVPVYVDVDAPGANDGSSWYDAFTTIQSALASITSGDIWVAEGIYYPDPTGLADPRLAAFRLEPGVHLFGGFDPSVGDDTWEERDPLKNITVLSGDIDGNDSTDSHGIITDTSNIVGANSYHVVMAEEPVETSAELDGFTITAGLADGAEPEDRGAGIYSSEASPTLANLIIQGNKAANSGGGMFMEIEGADFGAVTFRKNSAQTGGGLYSRESVDTISGIAFEGNEATASGGGMYVTTSSGQNLSNLTFTDNSASECGGGLYVQSGVEQSSLGNSTFAGNTAASGGGLCVDQSIFSLSSSSLVANEASEHGGGMLSRLSTYFLTGVTFDGNHASSAGGGVYADRNVGTVTDSTFLNNTSILGAGMYVDDGGNDDAVLAMDSPLFVGNVASEAGGGLCVVDSPEGTLEGVTFLNNEATSGNGGGMVLSSSEGYELSNTDFGHNEARAGGGLYVDSSDATIYNLRFDDNQATQDGGGMLSSGAGSDLELVNVAFAGNDAGGSGGGLNTASQNMTIVNAAFSGNVAGGNGGGLETSSSNIEVINVTFSGNAAGGSGGGVRTASPNMAIVNTVIWNNQDSSGLGTASASLSGSTDSIDYSLIQSQNPAGTGNLDGNNPDNDPEFVIPVDPSTAPTTSGILSVQYGSPIIDVGDNGAIPAGPLYEHDLDGNARIYNGTVDMGAYEFQLACPPELTALLYVDHTKSVGNSGTTWTDALKNLRDAFTLAENCIGITEIWVADGIYLPDEGVGIVPDSRTETYQLLDGVAVYGGFAGGEGSLVDRDWVTNVAVLSGDVDNNDISSGGIVLNPGNIRGANSHHVVIASGTGNTTVLDGFTITAGQANGTAPDPTSRGGGIYNDAGSPTLANLTFIGNYAVNGGGLANLNGSNPPLTDMQFTSNTAGTSGGAMYNLDSSPTLTGTLLSYNSASNGGGIYNLTSSPTLTNTVLSANTASINGGALYNDTSNPSLIQAQISGNSATGSGAAIYNTASSPVLVNVTVAGNLAGSRAGGAFNTADSDPLLRNTILWGNRDNTGTGTASATIYNDDVGSSVPVIDYCLVQDLSNIEHTGDNNLAENPWFTAPADPSAAPTTSGDYTLGIFSAAIDVGDNAANGLPTDLAGNLRIINGIIDLGAYEAPYVPIYDTYLPIVLRNYGP